MQIYVILGRILLVQLIEANNSLVVLEPKLVAWKTENTETNRTTGGKEDEERLNTSSRRGERSQARNTQEVSDRVAEEC